MKYCPYCGADFADGAASFCMECGKSLPIAEDGQKKPKEKPVKSQKRMEKKRKHPSPKPRKKHEKPVGEHMGGAFHPKDDGYDGYQMQTEMAESVNSDSEKALTDGLLSELERISKAAHEAIGFTYTPLEQLAALQ